MTKEELMNLVNAGFTKDDIVLLVGTQEFKSDQEQSEEETETKTNVQGDANKEKEKEETSPNMDMFTNMFDEMNKRMDTLANAMRQSNINNANMGDKQPHKSDEDIIASIIMPNKKENN